MLSAATDVEYMHPYPAGYVRNQIQPRLENLPVGLSITFDPDDYSGVPMLHFHNTLVSALASKFGFNNAQTHMNFEHGLIEAIRLR
jgi:hypothetical protein